MNDRHATERRRNAATFLALFGLLLVLGGLLGLFVLVMPQALGIVAVIGGFVFVALFHYMAWGWWMTAAPSEAARSETDDEFDV